MIEYKIFNYTKKGFVLSRKPFALKEQELRVRFENAPENGTAIFEDAQKKTVYRRLIDGACNVPKDFLNGDISVVIAVFSGNTPKYQCEGIHVERVSDELIVYPGGIDMPAELSTVLDKLEGLAQDNVAMNKKLNEANKKLEKILDGYDFE